jgi:hypothetical protein
VGCQRTRRSDANRCRHLTQFDLHWPEGPKGADKLTWETLEMADTGFIHLIREVPPCVEVRVFRQVGAGRPRRTGAKPEEKRAVWRL